MTFEDAFDKAVKAFYEGKQMSESEKVVGPMKYNKNFFDEFEKEIRPKGKKPVEVGVEDEEDDG